ncbi:tRNA dihydrouridine synthase [Blastopirellula retiformator]|uniref:tRNA-dihydrouridine synthase n=1 Tax=Blastopirellula retiformator TaxID=2527970 RepID=A0A5C5UYN6_9BACT|nr:tRNA-dihydrouridine synthase [Blastopirellula retiformator]TWT31351.1 tRNA-dihydrouridine synthase C [Blastopirellula retiformator]
MTNNQTNHIEQAPFAPLKIGDIELGFPVVQAALSGYSDMSMRVMARRFGASYAICEVMLDQFLVNFKDRSKNKHYLAIADEEHPVGGQLMGAEPIQFAAGAVKLVEAGYDVIDINFGCPVKKVLGRCRGGFHLSQPEVALEIVARTRNATPAEIPVTVKMRRGIDDTAESRDNFFRILDGAFDLGVAAITVHGRTVEQRYVGPSRWEFLRDVKAHVGDKTILGSGDLFTAQDCFDMMRQTGIDGVTVARGAIGNPWIFQQARALYAGQPLPPPPSLFEQRDVIQEHMRIADELYGEKRGLGHMRKFGIKYSFLHPDLEQVRGKFTKMRTLEDWYAIRDEHYCDDRPGNYLSPSVHAGTSEC